VHPVRRARRSLLAAAGSLLILAGLLPAAAVPAVAGAGGPVINEVLASTTGTDVEYVELFGTPGASLAGLSLVYVESNNGTSLGAIDFRYDFPASAALGTNGFYLVGTTGSLQGVYGVTPNVDIVTNSLENSSATVALVQTASLSAGSVGGSEIVLDAVAIADATASTFFFGAPVVGPDGTFFPAGVRRVTDGADTDTAGDWVIADFNLGAANTPTAAPAPDTAPTVGSTNPADGATNVPVSGDISVTFTESVDVAAGAVRVECPSGATQASNAAASDVTSLTINPASDLPGTTACVIVIDASGVTDNDGTPDALTGTTSFGFTTGASALITRISAIQGSGATAATGTFTVEGIVVGDYQTQGSGQLRGFFVQEENTDADADAATSEGIFVFCSSCPVAVSVGDKVRVTGSTSEFFGMSQLTASTVASVSVLSTGNSLPSPASAQLPVPSVPNGDLAAATAAINTYFEPMEGMLVAFPDTLSVAEYFELARFGQVILSEGGRPHQFTATNTPSASGLIDHEIDLARRTVILDDTDNRENRPVAAPNTAYYHPVPGLSTGNFFRGGDTITNLTGVLHWSFAGGSSPNAWRIRPVVEAFDYEFTSVNERPSAPTVDGRVSVASFNVLNYFLTIDTTSSNDVGTCGPSGSMDCRGADSVEELARQRAKLLAALDAMDADVVGLMEMENSPGVEPLADIVSGLAGYDYVDTDVIGTDAIRVGIIFKSSSVRPVGDFAILDSTVDPRFRDDLNRPPLAQTFEEIDTGARFTVVVNHLKSKGSDCNHVGDPDTGDGQGNCNVTRTLAAEAMADWLATDPTGSGDADVLIIGDLNSYAKEDPIAALESDGYTNLVAEFGGPGAYSFVFDGQLGYLDHALANGSLTPQVVDVAEWHINADEIPLFDYNDDARTTGEASFEEESDALPLYQANEFRTSDHDPVVIGLELDVCRFDENATTKTKTLLADCATDESIPVDDGWTLDGDGFEIRAFDQAGNPFVGGVIESTGAIAQVRDVTVTTYELADVCHGGDERLRGVLFDGAAGSVTDVRVVDLNQGTSGCQEGNAIEVRNEPFEAGGDDVSVLIQGNEVDGYQKTGIVVNGSVFATVLDNVVEGWGPTNVIAQNGIQVGFGGSAFIRGNSVSGNSYTGLDVACGLLFFEADGVKQQDNILFANEQVLCNFGRGGGRVRPS
jgi:predicted extracellular nuclease